MPRQGRSGGGARPAPSRPSGFSQPKPAPQQSRPSSTAAYPPANRAAGPPAAPAAAAPVQQSSGGGGLFANMASTAAGVAVGSSVGHAITGFFGGGSSAPAEQQQQGTSVAAQDNGAQSNSYGAANCDVDARNFTKCMDEQQGNMSICGWYMEQLKACQQAASQY